MTVEPTSSPVRRGLAGAMLLCYALLIYGGSSGPAPDVVVSLEVPDYFLHAAEYAVLGFLCSRFLLHLTLKTNVLVLVLLPVVLCALFGISDEIHQSFVPERDASIRDAIADLVGGALGAMVYRRLLLFRSRKPAIPEGER